MTATVRKYLERGVSLFMRPFRLVRSYNPLVRVRPGFSKVHLHDVVKLLNRRRSIRSGRMVLQVPFPGIGDHLFYTALPEFLMLNKLCTEVCISSLSVFRSPEMYDLIWGSNPFVSGKIDCPGWSNTGYRPDGGNFLDGIIFQFSGRLPRLGETTPKLYHRSQLPFAPQARYVLLDLNRISNKDFIELAALEDHLQWAIAGLPGSVRVIAYESAVLSGILSPGSRLRDCLQDHPWEIRRREARLSEYLSLVEHCDTFFGFYSGGALVAAAYRRPCYVYCQKKDPAISFNCQSYVECVLA